MTAIVRHLDECDERVLESSSGAGAFMRTSLDPTSGCPRLVQREVRLGSGTHAEVPSGGGGELWYVVRGTGSVERDGGTWALDQGTALFLPPGNQTLRATGPDELELVVVVLPADDAPTVSDAPDPHRRPVEDESPRDAVIAGHFESSPEERTGERTFRVLIGTHQGFTRATQFVGNIPPSRAPLHEHTYDEVVMVLAGRGQVHVGTGSFPLSPGTCIYLPPGTKHCLENDGDTMLRVLGVFCPGGTPAAKKEHLS
jgi:mannose-6-phosphate isomerase-like protein (cupin superfamily)